MATGAVQYVFTGAAYDTPVGIVNGGDWGDDTNSSVITGIGGIGVVVPGAQLTEVSFSLTPVDLSCLLDKILRATYPHGDPPVVPLHFGDDEEGRQGAEWRCNSAEIELAEEAALQVNFNWHLWGKPTDTTSAETYNPPLTPLIWVYGYVHLDDADCEARRCRFPVNNNLMAKYPLNQRAANTGRHPSGGDTGGQVPTAEIEMYAPAGHDLTTDALEKADVKIVCANDVATPTTATIILTDCKAVGRSSSFQGPNDRIVYTQRYELDYNTGVSIAVA